MAEMTNKRSRIKYISVLNALACFAVVMHIDKQDSTLRAGLM